MKSRTYNNMKTFSLLFIISLFINGVAMDESLIVNEGFSLTLHTNAIIQSNDVIEWRYGFKNELIAKLDKGSISFFNVSNERFTDRLKMNDQTGDLTIIDDTVGLYHLQITGEKTTKKTFNVEGQGGFTSGVTSLSVMEGDSVPLEAGAPDYDNYDVIHWRFNNFPLAEFNMKTKVNSTHDERFTDRLELKHWSGDLTITNITSELSGLYDVNVDSNSGTHTVHKTYTLTVSDEVKMLSVMEGDSVTLHTEDKIEKYGYFTWNFGPQKLRYGNRLHVDDRTGSLTITNITTEDSGVYRVEIRQSKQSIGKKFIVTVSAQDRSSGVRSESCVGVLLVFVLSQII